MSSSPLNGRPPKPNAVRRLEGMPGHRPLRREPKPRPVAPACPEWLDAEGRAMWRRHAAGLEALGLLTERDGEAFAALCEAWSELRALKRFLGEHGTAYTSDGRSYARPEAAQAEQAFKRFLALADRFGLTPVARGRMNLPEPSASAGKPSSLFD